MTDAKSIFTDIYDKNLWGSEESASGTGSTLKETEKLRTKLPLLLESILSNSNLIFMDAPCGDFNWFQYMDLKLVKYIGVDIVAEVINNNNTIYGNSNRTFINANIITDNLPYADVILCRDCLVHFPHEEIFRAISNFKKSGSKYLLTTTFPTSPENVDIILGNWRPLNLQIAPFNFPQPIHLLHEELQLNDKIFDSKSLGLWKLEDL
jgi:hypothetical protein